MYIILAFLVGEIIVISIMLNARLSKREGNMKALFVNYLTASMSSIALCLIMVKSIPTLTSFQASPLIYYVAGFIGIFTTYIFNIIVHKISAVYIIILKFIGQIAGSVVIDYLYFHIFSVGKIIGVCLFVLGLTFNELNKKKSFSITNSESLS